MPQAVQKLSGYAMSEPVSATETDKTRQSCLVKAARRFWRTIQSGRPAGEASRLDERSYTDSLVHKSIANAHHQIVDRLGDDLDFEPRQIYLRDIDANGLYLLACGDNLRK